MSLPDILTLRIYMPRTLVRRLDTLAALVGDAVGHEVARGAVIRGLVKLHVDKFTEELINAISTDDVKRGRPVERRPS
jgi:hypothetical protein